MTVIGVLAQQLQPLAAAGVLPLAALLFTYPLLLPGSGESLVYRHVLACGPSQPVV
jgi:hypothetical protein